MLQNSYCVTVSGGVRYRWSMEQENSATADKPRDAFVHHAMFPEYTANMATDDLEKYFRSNAVVKAVAQSIVVNSFARYLRCIFRDIGTGEVCRN